MTGLKQIIFSSITKNVLKSYLSLNQEFLILLFLIDNVPLLKSGIPKVAEIKVLGVTLTDTLSFAPHLKNTITKASQSLFALKILKSHGLQEANLHNVCKADNQLTHTLPSWCGFANSEDLTRLQKVLNRAARWGLHGGSPLTTLLALADKSDSLFQKAC